MIEKDYLGHVFSPSQDFNDPDDLFQSRYVHHSTLQYGDVLLYIVRGHCISDLKYCPSQIERHVSLENS